MLLCVFACLMWCHRTDMTPENPLWVGAWWIGFLAGGAAALLVAFPILGYPRQLPGTAPVYCSHVTHTHNHILYRTAILLEDSH